MSPKIIIKNGNVALPGKEVLQTLDIEIQNGRITALGSQLSGDEEIDASGCLVMPGGIDPHVHFDDPGYTEREDFFHGSAASAAGGITTVIDMPCTSVPPVTNQRNLREKHRHISEKAHVDYGFFGGVSSQTYERHFEQDMEELADTVLGFKTYFLSGMDTFKSLSGYRFMQVMKKAKTLGVPVLLHAEDAAFVNEATAIEQAKGDSWAHYYRSRPELAEIIAVQHAVAIARETGAHLHIVHIGTADAAALLKHVPQVTGETGPHYLAFSKDDFARHGSALKTAPVVKSAENRDALWQFLHDGVLDFVASDHAPAPDAQKHTGSVWTDYAGIPGSPTLLPYLFSEGYQKKRISLRRFLQVVAENAAKRYGIFNRKGSVDVGKDADLAIIDPREKWQVKGKNLYSRGSITPFEGMEMHGRIKFTILRGTIIYEDGQGITGKPGYGKLISPKRGSPL